MEVGHRHSQIGVLEHRAKRLFSNYTTWGELGASQIKLVARTAAETGKLLRFLVEANTEAEREMIRGLGLPALVFTERPTDLLSRIHPGKYRTSRKELP